MQLKTRISLVILLVIGLHAVPVLFYQGEHQTRWPFLAWSMYARSYPPGPITVAQRRLIATFASGKEAKVTAQLVGLPTPAFIGTYIAPLWKASDSTPAYELIRLLNRERNDPVVRLRLEGESQTLVDTGVVREMLPAVTYQAHPSSSR
jgi:hypothetical protein